MTARPTPHGIALLFAKARDGVQAPFTVLGAVLVRQIEARVITVGGDKESALPAIRVQVYR